MSELKVPHSVDEFKEIVNEIEAHPDYRQPAAFAFGVATIELGEADQPVEEGTVLDVQLIRRNYEANFGTAAIVAATLDQEETGLRTGEYLLDRDTLASLNVSFTPFPVGGSHSNVNTIFHLKDGVEQDPNDPRQSVSMKEDFARIRRVPILSVVGSWDDAPETVADTYLRLYALSERFKQPNTVNLDGAFGKLKNLVISEALGSFSVERWNEVEEAMVLRGISRAVRVLDKFPRMLDHVVPTGIRVADPSRVRLGAHLGEGTTVMPEGASNFNAGTLGASMVEGRISAGVVVGEGSDIGGGASTQGTLSGGGKEKVSIGERTLLEANCGVGISLGDDCRVEAGLYVKSTTPVKLPDGSVVKAATLSGGDNMMFRRNAKDGAVELVPNKGGEWGGLNTELHKN